jgi:hypothetical protein
LYGGQYPPLGEPIMDEAVAVLHDELAERRQGGEIRCDGRYGLHLKEINVHSKHTSDTRHVVEMWEVDGIRGKASTNVN